MVWNERTVEAIEQPIAVPSSSHFGVLERVQLYADMYPLCAHSRVRSCSPSLQGMGTGGGFKDGVKTFGWCMLLWMRRIDGA